MFISLKFHLEKITVLFCLVISGWFLNIFFQVHQHGTKTIPLPRVTANRLLIQSLQKPYLMPDCLRSRCLTTTAPLSTYQTMAILQQWSLLTQMRDQVGISDNIMLYRMMVGEEHSFELAMFSFVSACLGFYTQLVSSFSYSSRVVQGHCEIVVCYRKVSLEEQ